MYTHPFRVLNSPPKYVVLKQTISERPRSVHLPENTNIKAALFTEFHVIKLEMDDNIQYINSDTSS
jgi:hypothetical protein